MRADAGEAIKDGSGVGSGEEEERVAGAEEEGDLWRAGGKPRRSKIGFRLATGWQAVTARLTSTRYKTYKGPYKTDALPRCKHARVTGARIL